MNPRKVWTHEWPKKEGMFWYWGMNLFESRNGGQPTLRLVRVKATRSLHPPGSIAYAYIADGRFLYEEDSKAALWKPARMPKLPSIEELIGRLR